VGSGAGAAVLILAAGEGKRLKSKTIKLLHPVAGRPMVRWVADAVAALRPRRIVAVVGYQADRVREALEGACDAFAVQKEQRGTGHAVLTAEREVGREGDLLIVSGDVPSLRPATLRALLARKRRAKAAMALVTASVPDPTGYGRIVRDGGRVARIVEHKDATRAEREIREINCGLYAVDAAKLFPLLKKLRPDNAQGEYYLTDVVHALIAKGDTVVALEHGEAAEVLGVNTRAELAEAGSALYARKAGELQDGGVTILDPSRTWVDPRARVGQDTVLYPDVIIDGETVIGADCVIHPGCRLIDMTLAAGVTIRDHCVLESSRIETGAVVGPFARLRPGAVLEADTRVGNFVELKKTRLGRGSKAQHLAYLGDAEIGPRCNVGAGTITCNYDGTAKHRTTLGEGVFVGSDTQFVAPVSVGEGAYIAAGATVTEDVPPGALAISRARQVNLEGWVARRRAKSPAKAGSSHS